MGTQPTADTDTAGHSTVLLSRAKRRRELAARWDQLLSRIRHRDGFEHFLVPPGLADLQRTAMNGTVVIVNAGKSRSDAILLRTEA